MSQNEQSIAQNLRDAGCGEEDIEIITGLWRKGDLTQMKKQIARCRLMELDRLHESQKCIDRLDYLRYQLDKNR